MSFPRISINDEKLICFTFSILQRPGYFGSWCCIQWCLPTCTSCSILGRPDYSLPALARPVSYSLRTRWRLHRSFPSSWTSHYKWVGCSELQVYASMSQTHIASSCLMDNLNKKRTLKKNIDDGLKIRNFLTHIPNGIALILLWR